MFIQKEIINEVLSKTRIEELIAEYMSVERKGKDFLCTCPFHDDSNPSMHISPEKQIFKCFVCNDGGNAISFVQKYENISFVSAVKKLAERANVEYDFKGYTNEKEIDPSILRSQSLLKEVEEYSSYSLFTNHGSKALKYLKEQRKLNDDVIHKYRIGYVASTKELVNFLEKKGYFLNEMTEAGILRVDAGGCYSFVEDRILFPVHNSTGHSVGFSCRSLPGGKEPKYINSRESSVFKKGDVLFNFENARTAALLQKEIVLMEGQMNPIKASALGVSNCVAQMGTALTKEQVQLLKSLKVPVKMMYDGDSAGQINTIKNYHLLKDAGIDVRAVLLPDSLDPDELIEKDSSLFFELYELKSNILDYQLAQTIKNPDVFEEIEKFSRNFLQHLKEINDPLTEDFYFKKLSEKTNFDVTSLRKKMDLMKNQVVSVAIKKTAGKVKQVSNQHSSRKVLINFRVKPRLKASGEVEKNYDRLRAENKVLVFDKDMQMDRKDLLKKYIDLKGTVLESTITLVNYDNNVDCVALGLCQAATKEMAMSLNIPYSNIDYIAYLHTNTNHPHLHIQLFQKETYLDQYELSSKLVNQLQKVISAGLANEESLVEPVTNTVAI